MDATTKPAWEIKLERLIDAPRARVYEAWTKPEQMKEWFAPRPFQLVVKSMDFRPGGGFVMAMRGPDGSDFPFTGTYREIVPGERLVWNSEFPGDPKDNMTTVVTFQDRGGKTALTAVQSAKVMTKTMEMASKGANQGWNMTLDQLAGFVAR